MSPTCTECLQVSSLAWGCSMYGRLSHWHQWKQSLWSKQKISSSCWELRVGKNPPDLLAPCSSHDSTGSSTPQHAQPIWLGFWLHIAQNWRTTSFCTGSCRLLQCCSVLLYLGPLIWTPQNQIFPPSYNGSQCLHISTAITGRNSVLHHSFSQWDSPSSCGYGFTDQSCLLLALVCAVAASHATPCKKLAPGASVGNSDFNFPVFGKVLCCRSWQN